MTVISAFLDGGGQGQAFVLGRGDIDVDSIESRLKKIISSQETATLPQEVKDISQNISELLDTIKGSIFMTKASFRHISLTLIKYSFRFFPETGFNCKNNTLEQFLNAHHPPHVGKRLDSGELVKLIDNT